MPPDSPSKNKNRKFVDINKNCNEHALSTSNSAIQQIDRIPKGLIPQETIIFSPDVPASCQANKVKIVAKESTDFHAQAEYIVFDRYNKSKYSRTEAISDSENECKIVLMSLKSNKVLNTTNSFSENNVCETDEELTSLSWLHDKNLIKGIVARTSQNKKNAIIEPNDVNDVYMMSEKKASTEEAEFEVKKIHIEDGNVFLQKPNTHDHILNSINMESNIDSGQQNIFYNVDYLDMNSNNKSLISSNINTCDEKGNQNATFEIHEDAGSWKKIECDEKFGTSNEELFKDTNATNGVAAFINKETGVPYSPRKSSTNNALILKKPISNPTFKLHEYNTQQLSLRTAIQQECGAKMNEFDQNSLFCAITEVSSNSIHKNIHRLENSSLNSGHEHMLHSQQQNILDLKQKHKNVVLCDRPSNIHDLGKSPLSSPKKSLNVSYDPLVHTHNKPPYSFSSLIFMAIEASQEKALPVKEIYAWIVQHFPYFSTAPTGWKNSVRHNLSLNKSFVKVEKAPNMGKGSLWRVEQQQRENLIQALTRSPFFPNSKLGYTLQNRKVVNVEVDTFDLVPLSEKSYFDARLFPKLSKVIKSMEIQGHVENNSSNCSSSELDSYIYTKHPTIGCVGNSIDDVNAATAMLALKHGPKMLAENFEACSQVILSTPSEDHTYSAGINNGNDMNLISKRKFENSPALLVDEIKIFAKNDYSSQSNATLSDAAYESSEENDDIATPFDDSDQQRHLDGVDALLSLSSSVESSFTSISNTSDNFFNAYGSFDQGCTSQNCHQHSLPDSPLKNKSRFYL